MANQIISTTESTVIVPEVWSAKLYETLVAKLPFMDSVDREYEGEIKDLGDIVNITSIPEFDEGTVLAEGSANDAESLTLTGQQLTINKRVVKDFIVTKRAQLQSLPFMDGVRDKAVYAIQKKMQSLIIADIVPSASTPDHQIAYDSGSTLALADVLEAKELLDGSDVPAEDRKMINAVPQSNDLFNITGFVSKDFVPNGSPLSTAEFATPLAGFMPMWTSVLTNTSYLFHPSFLTMAVQDDLSIMVYDLGVEGTRASRVNVDLLFGLKQLDNKRVVQLS